MRRSRTDARRWRKAKKALRKRALPLALEVACEESPFAKLMREPHAAPTVAFS